VRVEEYNMLRLDKELGEDVDEASAAAEEVVMIVGDDVDSLALSFSSNGASAM
jgi:hypothetical protein